MAFYAGPYMCLCTVRSAFDMRDRTSGSRSAKNITNATKSNLTSKLIECQVSIRARSVSNSIRLQYRAEPTEIGPSQIRFGRHCHGICSRAMACLPACTCAGIRIKLSLCNLCGVESGDPVACPLYDAYHVAYSNNSGGFCLHPPSYLSPCAAESHLHFHLEKCAHVAYTFRRGKSPDLREKEWETTSNQTHPITLLTDRETPGADTGRHRLCSV